MNHQVQVIGNSFTYKGIKYNKNAVIDVDEIEQTRLLGSYPFAIQLPVVTTANLKTPAVQEPPASSQTSNSSPMNKNE